MHFRFMQCFDLKRYWTIRIKPHLADAKLNVVLVRDFNKYTTGRWGTPFAPGQFPCQFESCDWKIDHRGKKPRYWHYVKHAACHWGKIGGENRCQFGKIGVSSIFQPTGTAAAE